MKIIISPVSDCFLPLYPVITIENISGDKKYFNLKRNIAH